MSQSCLFCGGSGKDNFTGKYCQCQTFVYQPLTLQYSPTLEELKAKGMCPECYGQGAILNSHKCSEYYKRMENNMNDGYSTFQKKLKPSDLFTTMQTESEQKSREHHVAVPLSLVMELYSCLQKHKSSGDNPLTEEEILSNILLKIVKGKSNG